MSWEHFYATLWDWKPIWEYTMEDYLMDIGIVILYLVVRYYLYKFNIIESRFTKGMRELKERSGIFTEELKHYLDDPKEEQTFEDFEARLNERMQILESKKSCYQRLQHECL